MTPVLTPSERATRLLPLLQDDAAASDVVGGFPARSIGALGDAGLLRAPSPLQAGGEGLGDASRVAELLRTLAAVGRGNLAVGRLYEGHVNALQLIERYGSPAQQRIAAEDAAAGRLFGVWNTEADDGVRLQAGTDGRLRLEGAKTFASGCGHAARAVVTATDEQQRSRMLVLAIDHAPPAIDRSFWQPLGMRATASFRADFTGRTVEAGELLGEPGDYYREPAFSGGAIRFAAVQQGGVEAIFDETRRFLTRSGRAGDPFQRARLGQLARLVETGRLWLAGAAANAAAALPDPPDGRQSAPDEAAATVHYAHLVRMAIEAVALEAMPLAERSVGARGLLQPEPFERLHRDLTHYLRQPAPDFIATAAGAHVLERPEPAASLWRSPGP